MLLNFYLWDNCLELLKLHSINSLKKHNQYSFKLSYYNSWLYRSFLDSCDGSFEMLGSLQQPEVTTMTMNGREVVVIDADLFSQIVDELTLLKAKLSQLSDVIQVLIKQNFVKIR